MQKLQCISLYQPYASLCVIGAKRFETRSRDTYVRGTLGIHATKSYPNWCKELAESPRFYEALKDIGVHDLPTQMIVGTVDIISTIRTDVWLSERMYKGKIDPEWENEFHFGDYGGGRYAWELVNPIIFGEPIPAKGSQGFWFYDGLTPAHNQSFIRK